MKDAEARSRIEKLEAALPGLPDAIAKVVIDHFEPRIAQVNETLERMRDAAAGIEGLAAIVQQMGDATNENAELLSVLESELNTLRVDFNAIHVAQAEHAAQVEHIRGALHGVAQAFGRAAS